MSNSTIGFLGPSGTFTEEALRKIIDKDQKTKPLPSISGVINAVQNGEVDKGFVAIENSIEGSVNTTLDVLTFETDVLIEQEFVYSISHNLISRFDLTKDSVEAVISHPQATAQCRGYLLKSLPGAHIEAANSTAEAAKIVSEERGGAAAISTKLAAEIYGLKILEEDIQDFKDNQTRFVMLGNDISSKTGRDKTSIVCFIKTDRPGSLLEILQAFAENDVNLTKIQSRPTRKALGEYYFFIDLEGHIEDEKIINIVEVLRNKLREVKLLGSYPMVTSND